MVTLSPEASRRIEIAASEITALQALCELADLLHVDAGTRWEVARVISARLARFEATAWPRIAAGYREPRDRLEKLLAAMAASKAVPRSPRRIFDLLD